MNSKIILIFIFLIQILNLDCSGPKEILKPLLKAEVFLEDSSNNGILESIEPANLKINIKNIGKGTAKNLIAYISLLVIVERLTIEDQSNQVSNWYPEKKHGMFTYFFLKGLKGEADIDKDGKILISELKNFINDENNNLPYVSKKEFSRPQKQLLLESWKMKC